MRRVAGNSRTLDTQAFRDLVESFSSDQKVQHFLLAGGQLLLQNTTLSSNTEATCIFLAFR